VSGLIFLPVFYVFNFFFFQNSSQRLLYGSFRRLARSFISFVITNFNSWRLWFYCEIFLGLCLSVSFAIISIQNYVTYKEVCNVLLGRACTLSKFNPLGVAWKL